MSKLIFKNNATSTLAGQIQSTSTQITVAATTGILFAQPGPNQYWVGTLTDAATGLLNEIVWVTAVNGDTLTVVRGQEGTTPQVWNANDLIAELWTAGQCQAMLQVGDAQAQGENYGVDTGVTNAYVVALTPPIVGTVPVGMPIRVLIKSGNTNTGAATLNVGTGAITIATQRLNALIGGEIPGGGIVTFLYDGTRFQIQSVGQPGGAPGDIQYMSSTGQFAGVGNFTFNVNNGQFSAPLISGNWNGSAIPIGSGGTGLASMPFQPGNPGYVIVPPGILFEWGQALNIPWQGSAHIGFPRTFGGGPYIVTITSLSAMSGSGNGAGTQAVTETDQGGFTVFNGLDLTDSFNWFAVGAP